MKSTFDILSFDGGGSKGVMEVVILKDVMNLVTLIVDSPGKIQSMLTSTLFATEESRIQLADMMDSVDQPRHPTEAFDMIVGTSTGALISFALVGGNSKSGSDGRAPMTVDEVIHMYKLATPRIFLKPNMSIVRSYLDTLASKMAGMPLVPYGTDGLNDLLVEYYGDATLKDFPSDGCIAGAVARRFNSGSSDGTDKLELFDTRYPISHDVVSVLKASTNAPVYFQTPIKVGNHLYVDGGVGGNCPLVQAIPRMRKLSKGGQLGSVLSIAPPRSVLGPIPESGQAFFWVKYFPGQITDGYAVYAATKDQHPDAIFQRLRPNSAKADKFAMDEQDIDAMIHAIQEERSRDPGYLEQILETALVISSRLLDKQPDKLEEFHALQANFVEWAVEERKGESALAVSKAYLKRLLLSDPGQVDKVNLSIAYYQLGICHRMDEEFLDARECFKAALDVQVEVDEIRTKILDGLGQCSYFLGDYDLALTNFNDGLDVKRKNGQNKESIARTLSSLGKVYQELNAYDKSSQCFEESLNILKSLDGDNGGRDGEIAEVLLDKGNCLLIQYKLEPALDLFQQSQDMWTKLEGTSWDCLASVKAHLGYCHVLLGHLSTGIELLDESLSEYQKLDNDNQFSVQMIQTYLWNSSANLQLARYDFSLKQAEHGLKLAKQTFGQSFDHPLVAQALSHLGDWHLENGQVDKALEFYTRSHDMQVKVYQECQIKHPMMINSLVGKIMSGQEKEADKCLKMAEELVPNSLLMGQVLLAKARVLGQLGQNEQSIETAKQALAMTKSGLGENPVHPAIIDAHLSIAIGQLHGQNLSGVQGHLDEARTTCENLFGQEPMHPKMAKICLVQGKLYLAQNEEELARSGLNKSLDILKHCFDNDHPDILLVQNELSKMDK